MTWIFDVDGTLIGSIRSERLRPGVTELLDALAARQVQCILWSAGGGPYARRKANEHGVEDHFHGFYGKAERGEDGRYLLDHLPGEHPPAVFVDDAPGDLPVGARVVEVPQFLGGNLADRAIFHVVDRLDEILQRGAPTN
jgi:phosphoglycolate phosphatase-like HAD superfamily hydrolase